MTGNEELWKENQALRNEIAELKGKLQKVYICKFLLLFSDIPVFLLSRLD